MQTRESASDPRLVADNNKNNKNISQDKQLIDLAADRRVYFSEAFARRMAAHAEGSLAYRINGAIVKNAQQLAGKNIFYLYWTDQSLHLHPLKVTLTVSETFSDVSSRFLMAENIGVLVPEYREQMRELRQQYYLLKVEQVCSSSADIRDLPFLTMWFTMNGLIGELCNVTLGHHFSGSEVLRVYRYFASFLNIEKMFICDDAVLAYHHTFTSIPVRFITALASGKTWFEKELPGLKLFDSRHLPIQAHDVISQSSHLRHNALRELQQLPLVKWSKMLDEDEQQALRKLYQKYFEQKTTRNSIFRKNKKNMQQDANFDDKSLQELMVAVCQDARSQRLVTAELYQLFYLLSGNIALGFGNIPLDRESCDYWVKSRVHQLMWGSYVWVQQSIKEERGESLLL